jgi:hypothetical protein
MRERCTMKLYGKHKRQHYVTLRQRLCCKLWNPLSWSAREGNNQNLNAEPTVKQPAQNVKYMWLKFMHGFFMFYAQVMLLGAGMAFSSDNRTGFSYKRGADTDMLIGRCYGRDLRDPSGPAWLIDLACGYGLLCAVSSANDTAVPSPNPYLSAP